MTDHAKIIKTAEQVLELDTEAMPGPWEVGPICRVNGPGGFSVCLVAGDGSSYSSEKNECHARLIAFNRKSAPVLANAVIEMTKHIEVLEQWILGVVLSQQPAPDREKVD